MTVSHDDEALLPAPPSTPRAMPAMPSGVEPIAPWGVHGLEADAARTAPYVTHDALRDLASAVAARALAHRAVFSIAGSRVAVQSNIRGALDLLLAAWRPFVERSDTAAQAGEDIAPYAVVDVGIPAARSPLASSLRGRHGSAIIPPLRSRYILVAGGEALYAAARLEDAVDFLDWAATTTALSGASSYAVFHSAALSWGGQGLLLPAASGSGKTTLTAALIQAGFGYLSDEAALVDPRTGRIDAYPKSLSIKRPALLAELLALSPHLMATAPAEPGRIWRLDPTWLAPDCPRASTTARVVVFPHYDPTGTTALQPIGHAAAALRLLRHGVNAPASPPRGVPLAGALVAGAACYQLTVNSLPAAVRLITNLCAINGAGGDASDA